MNADKSTEADSMRRDGWGRHQFHDGEDDEDEGRSAVMRLTRPKED